MDQKTLVVSHNGSDVSQCGVEFPCRTIIYTLSKRARSNDIIQIDNQDMEIFQPYVIDVSSPTLENIRLTGINGRPTVTVNNFISDTYLFDDEVKETQINLSHIAIRIENICFTNIGIVRVKKASSNLMVHIINSTVSQLMYDNTASIISSSATMTMVLVQNSLLRNIMKGICLESAHNVIKIMDSKVLYDEQKLTSPECPQLIVTGESVSLSAHFIRSKFKQIILIDLKSTEQTTSNINIIDSVFDDEGISDCSSHMRIRDGTIFIANSSFTKIVSTKQLICVLSSYVVLQKCIFRNIRSFLSPLEISLKSVASINDCQFENNSGLNGAVIHASLNLVLNMHQCVFKRNRAKSQGGALMISQTLSINISGCLFINNHAEDKGGAIYYRTDALFLSSTVFINNTAKGGGAAISGTSSGTSPGTSVLNVIHCVFKRNKGEKDGGIISLQNTFNVNISQCLFTENLGGGTVIINYGIKVTVSNTEFTNNTVNIGAAVFVPSVYIFHLVQCAFKRNIVEKYGGMIILGKTFNVNISQCLFKENYSTGNDSGTIIVWQGSKATVSNTEFRDNTADSGIAVCAHSVLVFQLVHCVFKRNKVEKYGAIIWLNNTWNVNISRCLFTENYLRGNDSGTITVRRGNKVTVSNTEFTNNTADSGAGIYAVFVSVLNVFQCVFKRNRIRSFGSALCSFNTSTINILRCLFTENYTGLGGGAIFSGFEDKLIVSDTEFISNTVKNAGGAIHATNLIIICSSFRRNKAGYGGAITVRTSLDIKNATFENNLAENSYRYGSGYGGALNMYSSSKVKISDSLFKDNMAEVAGGSIYSMIECSLSIKRTLFQVNSYSSKYRQSRGVILHSSGELILEDVCIQDLDEHNTKNSLIMHTSKFQRLKINRINITCSTGKEILATVPNKPYRFAYLLAEKALAFFTVSCSSCSSYSYSLSAGKLGPDLNNQSHINCYKCPFGGNCTDGRIKAASNFWGYIPNRSTAKLHFLACPFGYGCSGSSCTHYNSCGTGRKNVLCGQCKKGLTENIVTNDCLSSQQCRHPWFWLVILTAGILYVLLFLFLKQVANLFTNILVPKCFRESSDKNIFGRIKDSLKNLLHQNPPAQLRMDDACCEQSEADYVHAELLDTTDYTTDGMNYKKSHSALFPGMFKIVLFFHQSSLLFKVFSTTKSHGFTHIIQEVIATLFNLRADGIFSQDISWCPFDNLQPVSKILFKLSFILYLFAIIFFIFLIFKICKMIRKGNDHQSQTFYSRICCCVLRLLLISYSTITVTCFSLLSCVNLDLIGKVLFHRWINSVLHMVAIHCYHNSLYLDRFLTNCNLRCFMVIALLYAICRKVSIVTPVSTSNYNLLVVCSHYKPK